MAGAIVSKVLNFFGVDNEPDNEEKEENVYTNIDNTEDDSVEEKRFFGRKSKIVSMPQVQPVRMKIMQATSFEQSEEICNYLKERESIIVNLEYVNKDVARRIIDFISGSVHALDGHIQKISNAIFLVAPVNYDITSDLARQEIKSKLSVSWLKNN